MLLTQNIFQDMALGNDSTYYMFSIFFCPCVHQTIRYIQTENFPCSHALKKSSNVSPTFPPNWKWCRIFHIFLCQSPAIFPDVSKQVYFSVVSAIVNTQQTLDLEVNLHSTLPQVKSALTKLKYSSPHHPASYTTNCDKFNASMC